ncbi:MAG: MarR family winged helix-turn-helix transcriptional regulator [Proteobacteria bacterium]|nr:MarR family winged helix-turn-helix transcriptional regulator [Pseudomonadota bacterium]
MSSTHNAPRGCTNFKARQLSRLLSRHYDIELAKSGLKTTQYSLLTHVMRLGPIAPGELARQMGLDASTLTRNLQPLVAGGWILQGAGADARSRLVTITTVGRGKQIEAQQHWKAAQRTINAILGAEQVSALHLLLDDCVALLESTTVPT